MQAIRRALAHVDAAKQELEEAAGAGVGTSDVDPSACSHAELYEAYCALQREHEAVVAQYEADKRVWADFKRWWKHKLQAKRQAHRAARSSSVLSPRKAREQIQAHRRQVRALMHEHPGLFKGGGRYASSTKAPRSSPSKAPGRSESPKKPPPSTPPDYWYVAPTHPGTSAFPAARRRTVRSGGVCSVDVHASDATATSPYATSGPDEARSEDRARRQAWFACSEAAARA